MGQVSRSVHLAVVMVVVQARGQTGGAALAHCGLQLSSDLFELLEHRIERKNKTPWTRSVLRTDVQLIALPGDVPHQQRFAVKAQLDDDRLIVLGASRAFARADQQGDLPLHGAVS